MASIIRTKKETIATVSSSARKITIVGLSSALTIDESRELRGLLKAEERKAQEQSSSSTFGQTFNPYLRGFNY